MLRDRNDFHFAIAVAVALGIFLGMIWLYPWPSYPSQNQSNISQQYQSTNNAQPTTSGAHQPAAQPCDDKCTRDAENAWWAVRIAVIAAVIAFGQTILFWWQLGAMRKGLVDTARQAAVAEQTFAKIERPYIFVANARWDRANPNSGSFQTPIFVFDAFSGGKLPAIIDEAWITLIAGEGFFEDTSIRPLLANPVFPSEEKREIRNPFNEPGQGTSSGVTFQSYESDEDTVVLPVSLAASPQNDFIVRVFIAYHGPFTGGHETESRWQWEVGVGFRPMGGAAHNYNK